ncbi:LLM class F420-dependent oxidoreductase [Dactylosporangium sp. AC04546]|uniref:LLM class F420-dependent oxidoreductase n=1 Tax=Dactylosporangium sp. AC04546 TaxID=2862460 RepID=UPI001EE03FF7|nr:LLM class F420-dependent oxidoreductase [Dactylosporangium sp. AC04546]WVK85341.1 LLM class F420-dependent oxidoreductase [Dactylosporangium sp. AC04546]
MRLCVFTEPQQGASYEDQLAIAQRAEALGFEAFFRSDHYVSMGGTGLPGPTDSWVTLGALARETSTIRLGTLVTSATFRYPGPLAVAVAQVDAMSNGRVEVGLGAGWFEVEHTAYGIPFPPVGERFDRLSEQLAILTGLWSTPAGQTFSFEGRYYDIVDSPALPKPVQQPGPPVIIGGKGPRRTPQLAARYGDEFNVPFSTLADTDAAYKRVVAAIEEEGRDGRAPIVFSFAQTIICGETDSEVRRRADSVGLDPNGPRERGGQIYGTPSQVAEQLSEFAKAGASRAFLQLLDMRDLDHLELIAAEVAPLLP